MNRFLPLLAFFHAVSALWLRHDLIVRYLNVDTTVFQQVRLNRGETLLLTRGYRYDITVMANDHDLLQLFDTPTPSINMQKVVPINLLLISELKFHEFSHDRRVVDNIRNGPSSLIDLLSLYRDHEVYSPACPSEIRFIGATGIEDPEQKYLLLLRICTGDSFLDAPYNIMNSAISYYMVVQRSADQHYHFLPLMPSSVELSFTDHERVNNIGNGILPSPISDAMLGKIQAMTGRRKLDQTELLLAIDDQLMRAHLSLTELLSRQISHASIQFKLQLTASAYILNPLCPYYSSFTKQPTDFPYYLKAFLKNDAAIRLFEEYLELEMSKMLGRFLVNFNQGLCDNALAQKVFKTDSITKDHLSRLKMMTMMPSIGFYDELNLYIAAGGGIHEGESAPDYNDKQLGDSPLATINFDAESPFPSQ